MNVNLACQIVSSWSCETLSVRYFSERFIIQASGVRIQGLFEYWNGVHCYCRWPLEKYSIHTDDHTVLAALKKSVYQNPEPTLNLVYLPNSTRNHLKHQQKNTRLAHKLPSWATLDFDQVRLDAKFLICPEWYGCIWIEDWKCFWEDLFRKQLKGW